MVTSKTADRLRRMALQAVAISDFLYEEDGTNWREAREAVSQAANLLATVAGQIDERVERYKRSVLTDPSEG